MRNWQPSQGQTYLAILTDCATNFGVFRIAGKQHYVHDAVTRPNRDVTEQDELVKSAVCLVSGEHGPIARLHEPKIKGVSGAQAAGALLVSFIASAFTSYGKDQGENAPVSVVAAFKYATALNHLLDRRDRRVGLGDASVTYWADNTTPDSEAILAVLNDLFAETVAAEDLPKPTAEDQKRIDEAARLLNRLRSGTPESEPESGDDRTAFSFLVFRRMRQGYRCGFGLCSRPASLLTQERGLKLAVCRKRWTPIRSLLTQERGLKPLEHRAD